MEDLDSLAAGWDMPVPTDDQAVLRRVKAFAATRPLHELNRNKAMWSTDGIDWNRYDVFTLALATARGQLEDQVLSEPCGYRPRSLAEVLSVVAALSSWNYNST